MDIQWHKNWIKGFVAEKIRSSSLDPEPLELKLEHTFSVLRNAEKIGAALPAAYRLPLRLAALYHDVARFDQYLRFKTFKDAVSFNHGFRAVKILKQQNLLSGFQSQTQKLALTAVALHNRAELPKTLPEAFRLVCEAVRDADKLDILRVMDRHLSARPYNPTIILGLPDSGAPGNPGLVELTLAGKVGTYASLRTVNDFRLLLGAWYFDLHSDAAREIFINEGHGPNIVTGLPDNGHYGKARAFLLAEFSKNGT